MSKTIKIAIADDQTLFREGLKMILQTFHNLEMVIEAENGVELINALKEVQPDVILLDYTMPEMDGYETMMQIRQHHPDIKVIILSMHHDTSLMTFMMKEGANGYLLKDEEPQEVRMAIEKVLLEGHYFPDYVSKALLDAVKSHKKRGSLSQNQETTISFSDREEQIMRLIGTMSRKEMARTIHLSVKTIDFHIRNLKDKTNCASTAELIRFAIQHKYQEE
jgi:DNA-binding NarL/FixJ family response regulator